ncbi:MAG: glycosyltransferase family 9 protein [Vicingaceae bacterium]
MKRFLIIQPAFIGDVVLATVLIEKLHDLFPDSKIDFLLRKGNEDLLIDHPKLNRVIVWSKSEHKYLNLLKVIYQVRRKPYHLVINAHRFTTSGLISWLARAREKVGFDKNPFAFSFTYKVNHDIGNGIHEVRRNLKLIEHLGGHNNYRPKLYFSENDQRRVNDLVSKPYVSLAPASVWFTKQMPKEKWAELIERIPDHIFVCLLGGANDVHLCEQIALLSKRENVINLAGKLRMLESAALMKSSLMNYSNDSAPMHFSSAVNAPTTAFYCSTIPDFGFGPLSDESFVCQTNEALSCRPCGLHGKTACPQGHFKCGTNIDLPVFNEKVSSD